uniref:Delta-like protein n=1 Tax=Panagrellus redivivus TaxID=6233 RepID=A0A7E4V470_PANRE
MQFPRLRLLALASTFFVFISHITSVMTDKDQIATFEIRLGSIHPLTSNETYNCSTARCPINLCLKQYQQVFKLNEDCVFGSAELDFPSVTHVKMPIFGDALMADFTFAVSLFSPSVSNVTYPQTFTDLAQPSTTWTTRAVNFKAANGEVDIELRYRIVCADGFYGPKCNRIQERSHQLSLVCDPVTCEKGICNDRGGCECFSGFTGPKCDQCIPSYGCQGYCNLPGECICLPNYGGKNCAYDLTKCQSTNMCKNGGTCDVADDASGDFVCRCAPGFTGPTCSIAVRDCESSPCTNNGTCHMLPDNSDFVCECPEGLTGRLCQKRASSCSDSPCFNGAICKNSRDQKSFTCECNNNWTGRNCDIPITLCKPDSCSNGAKCVNDFATDLGYRCECMGGYYGSKCERRLRDYVGPNAVCRSFKCHNGGICIQRKGQPMCDCPAGFSGFRCETDDNECHESKCQNGGYCANTVSPSHCVCPRGFYGAQCQFAMTLIHDTDYFPPTTAAETNALPPLWQLILIVVIVSIVISLASRYITRIVKNFRKQAQPTPMNTTTTPTADPDTSITTFDSEVVCHQKDKDFCSSAPGALKNCEQYLTHSPPNPRLNRTSLFADNRYVDGPWRPRTPEALRQAASKHQVNAPGSPDSLYQKISYETVPAVVHS